MVPNSWTVIAYFVADDDRKPVLNPFASAELAAIKQAAIDEDIQLAAYVDFTGPQVPSRRCIVRGKGNQDPRTCSDTVEENSATMTSLREFLKFAKENTEATSRTAMFLWGHGAGPAGFFLDPTPQPQKSLTLPEIREAAFQAMTLPIDVLFFRDCWTANLELAYQFDGLTRYVIACQGLVPIPGVWPFRKLFQMLKALPEAAGRNQIARLLEPLDDHYQSESNRGIPPLGEVRFAALDIAGCRDKLKKPLKDFVAALRGLTGADRLNSRLVLEKAKGGDAALVDVVRMCETLTSFQGLGKAATALYGAVAPLVIDQTNGTPGYLGNSLTGVSLFRRPAESLTDSLFIDSIVYDAYKGLPLCAETGWHDIAYETLLD